MENSKLIKISLIMSIIGILSLLLIVEFFPPELIKIKDITEEHLEKSIRTQGTITQIKATPGLVRLKLKDSNKLITVILFTEEEQNIELNSKVEILGKIESYQYELEILADKITLLE